MKKYSLPFLLLVGLLAIGGGCSTASDTTTNTSASDDTEIVFDDFDDEIEVVSEDVYGKDLEQVERYPDSVRSYYEKYDDEVSVSYQTEDDQEKVRTYYDELLQGEGWKLSGESTEYMEYTQDQEDGEEYITVYLYEYAAQGITEYELIYEPPYNEDEGSDELKIEL